MATCKSCLPPPDDCVKPACNTTIRDIPGTGECTPDPSTTTPPSESENLSADGYPTTDENCVFDFKVAEADHSNVQPAIRVRVTDICGRIWFTTESSGIYTVVKGDKLQYWIRFNAKEQLGRDGYYTVQVRKDGVTTSFKIDKACSCQCVPGCRC